MRNARETMRATVIGAGNYSMDISGSTIEYTADLFPMKNIPVVRPLLERPEDIPDLDKSILQRDAALHGKTVRRPPDSHIHGKV